MLRRTRYPSKTEMLAPEAYEDNRVAWSILGLGWVAVLKQDLLDRDVVRVRHHLQDGLAGESLSM